MKTPAHVSAAKALFVNLSVAAKALAVKVAESNAKFRFVTYEYATRSYFNSACVTENSNHLTVGRVVDGAVQFYYPGMPSDLPKQSERDLVEAGRLAWNATT